MAAVKDQALIELLLMEYAGWLHEVRRIGMLT